jgi:hypothetical protein
VQITQGPAQGSGVYFPNTGNYKNIEEFLPQRRTKANKDAGSGAFSLPFSPYSPLRCIFSSRII